MIATGEFSAKICKTLGFKQHLILNYDEYKNENGEYIFKNKVFLIWSINYIKIVNIN